MFSKLKLIHYEIPFEFPNLIKLFQIHSLNYLIWKYYLNYKLNYYDNVTGYLPNREMNVTRHAAHEWRAPTPIGGGMRACFDSGNVEMSQTGNVIHVNINDYKFNGEFPREWVGSHYTEHIVRYPDNVGCFNVS